MGWGHDQSSPPLPRRPLPRRATPLLIAAVLLFAVGAALLALGSYEHFGLEVPQALRFVPLALVCPGVVLRRTWPGMALALGPIGFSAELAIGFSLGSVRLHRQPVLVRPVRFAARAADHGADRGRRCAGDRGLHRCGGRPGRRADQHAGDRRAGPGLADLLGIIVRQAHERATLEAERAEQTTRLADVRRREAVLRERTLMARELHDTVANYLSAIALQSTALQARKDLDAETVRTSVAAIRSRVRGGPGGAAAHHRAAAGGRRDGRGARSWPRSGSTRCPSWSSGSARSGWTWASKWRGPRGRCRARSSSPPTGWSRRR